MSHKIIKCRKCGTIIMQCRCPSKDKEVEYSDCGCTPPPEGEALLTKK